MSPGARAPVVTGGERLQFVVAGVQKAGTTSLFAYLAGHPELAAPVEKELHFFDDEAVDWAAPDFGPLHAKFPDPAGGRLRFEATPAYLFWPGALARLRRYNPGVRLILIFRDPIERAWSHWGMECGRDKERRPFAEAIRAGSGGEADLSAGVFALRHHSYVARGFYGRQLRQAVDLFPREQLLLLESGELRRAPDAVLAQVARFLGIAPFAGLTPREDNKGMDRGPIPEADVTYLRGLYRDDIAAFAGLSGLPIAHWRTLRGEVA